MAIKGINTFKNNQIVDERGKIILFVKKNSKYFENFGELYCSEIKPGKVKAWRKHNNISSLFTIIKGKVKMVIAQKTVFGNHYNFDEIILSEDDMKIVKVKPNIWYGFKCLGEKSSIITNFLSDLYDENEIERIKMNNNKFKYNWAIKNK